jgi:hypothetical protein
MLLIDFLDQLGLRHLHLHFCLLPVDSVQRTVFCNSARNAASAIIFTASFKPQASLEAFPIPVPGRREVLGLVY